MMASKQRLIDANALKERAIRVSTVKEMGSKRHCYIKAVGTHEIDKAPTVDSVPLNQYNELKERYKRLLGTASILDSALRAYQRKYGDLDDEAEKMDGGNEDG
jgi:hypothetical protein